MNADRIEAVAAVVMESGAWRHTAETMAKARRIAQAVLAMEPEAGSPPASVESLTLWRWAWARVMNTGRSLPALTPMVSVDQCPKDTPAEAAFRDAFQAEFERGAEAAKATHALVSEALRALRLEAGFLVKQLADMGLPSSEGGSVHRALRAADAALAPSALEASGRRYRVQVREVGDCTRCHHEAEARQPGLPDEFSCAVFCCPCLPVGRCEVVR